MPETEIIEEDVPVVSSTEKENASQTAKAPLKTSRESLWGAVLFACMLLFVVASIGAVGWVTYRGWQSERAAKSQPSITVLSKQVGEEKNTVSEESAPASADTPAPKASVDESAAAAKKLEISILNGGAAKGSAGILVDFLKKEGYSKIVSGNTINNYTGIVIYYASGLEKEVAMVKESVAKKYPQVKTLPADAKNKETSVAQVTIILGK